jgi:hypothetical protein
LQTQPVATTNNQIKTQKVSTITTPINKIPISSSSSSSPVLLLNNDQKSIVKPKPANNSIIVDSNIDRISPATYNRIPEILRDLLLKIQNTLAINKLHEGIWPPEIKKLFLK